jgi:hypothetical protein
MACGPGRGGRQPGTHQHEVRTRARQLTACVLCMCGQRNASRPTVTSSIAQGHLGSQKTIHHKSTHREHGMTWQGTS